MSATGTNATTTGLFSTTNFTATNATTTTFAIGAFNGTLFATAGVVQATSTLAINNGGTGASTFGQGWIFSSGAGALAASTSPTVNYIVATSTTAFNTFAGKVGIGTTSPWGKLSIEMDTDNPSFVVSNLGSSTPAFYISGVDQDGRIGINTFSTSTSRVDILDVSNPQLRLSQSSTTASVFADLKVAAATGDFTFSLNPSSSGNDFFINQPNGTIGANLWVCKGDACPTGIATTSVATGGNIIAETGYYLGNGFKIDQVVGTTTEIAIFNTVGGMIIIFDEF